ncbi:hypothetical protein ACMSE1_06545 [Bacteroides thetaiotaomicron]|uniref:hypothetical protein n=1 Tax=Bacteroides thetaiotaomicron TaxID=818 RepID=UPI0039C00B76
MKRILLLPLVALLFSCGGTTGKYEKLIADVVQTDGKGTKYDLNFKADNLEEIRQITVADSIQIIADAFNADKDKKRAQLQQSLTRNQESLDKEKNSRYPGKTMMTFYQKKCRPLHSPDRFAGADRSGENRPIRKPGQQRNTGGSRPLHLYHRRTADQQKSHRNIRFRPLSRRYKMLFPEKSKRITLYPI